jgi:predicted branched-subunit amino acid permease
MSIHRPTARVAASVAVTVGAYGVAFGAAGVAAGFSVLETCLFSLVAFTGASQFAAVGVVGAGGSPASAIAAATLLGVRNTLYGVQMAPLLRVTGWRRAVAAQLTIDESTGVALGQAPDGTLAMRQGFWLTGAGVYLFWNLATLAGALGARALGDPSHWGLDAAVPAAFLALVWRRLETNFLRGVAGASVAFCLVVTPWLPVGLPIVATTLVAVVAGWRERG